MGASHIAAIYANWCHLPDRPFRLLCYMALVVPDKHKHPKFFGGREAMCEALGMEADDRNANRMVSRAAAELEKAGAIRRLPNTGFRGRRQEYEIHLVRMTTESPNPSAECVTPQSPNPERKGDSTVLERVTPESEKGDSRVRKGGLQSHPKEYRGETRSDVEEEDSPTKVSPDRAREGQRQPLSPRDVDHILRAADANGIDVATPIREAPAHCDTRAKRRAWVAAQLLDRTEAQPA